MYRQLLLLFLVLVATVHAQNQKPPKIKDPEGNVWNPPAVAIRSKTSKQFKCKAEGYPPPLYKWYLNGVEIGLLTGSAASCNSFLSVDGDGTLFVSDKFNKHCDGDYQCVATNQNGASMTPYLRLNATDSNTFTGDKNAPPKPENIAAYDYLTLPCENIPYSSPPYEIVWLKAPSSDRDSTKKIDEDERIVIDPQGSIHFLWVLPEDNGWVYKCAGKNIELLSENANTISYQLEVTEGSAGPRQPQDKYAMNVVAMKGTTAKLLCIFSYYSRNKDLKITWTKGSSPIPRDGKYEVVNYGRELQIKEVQVPNEKQSVEGYYECKAELQGFSEKTRRVRLTVVAPPVFTGDGRLNDIKVPLGSDAEFMCKTLSHRSYSKPVVWLENGDPLAGCIRPKSFQCTEKLGNDKPQCLPESQRCDSIEQCSDGTDERQNCPISCSEGTKLCNNVCIATDQECVEAQCNYDDFRCGDKSCISHNMVCDGNLDCADGSDETRCYDETIGRFTLTLNRTKLTLKNVQINDNMCVQCMVQNDYGTLFGDGCLTVIDKIVVTAEPNSTYLLKPGENVTISVEAKHSDVDLNYDMSYEWFWVDKEDPNIVEELPPRKYQYVFKLSQTGKDLTIKLPNINENKLSSYETYRNLTNRKFFVKIGHKYENITRNFTIQGIEVTPPVTQPTVQSAGGDLWWLAIIVGVIFLIVVVIVIFCYLYRNRGGVYLLDKKEHKAGHDPEKELKDSGFHDVGRVGEDEYDEEKPNQDQVSLTESVKPYDSDEDITEEYGGDFDVSKFNEDGSFIGIYGDKKSKAKEATV